MGTVGETVSLFNTTIRTLLALVVVGGLSLGSYYGYNALNDGDGALAAANDEINNLKNTIDERDATIAAREEEIAQKQEEINKLETSMRYLKFSKQLARITVKSKFTNENNETEIIGDFVELDGEGRPIRDPKEFKVIGDEIYVDALIVKFKDKFIEEGADPVRSSSICMFRRIFGDAQEPKDVPLIYKSESEGGLHPAAYARGSVLSPLEKRIWKDFWTIANDPREQNELGIRSNHGTAVTIKPEEGKSYQIRLRSAGGLNLLTDDEMVRPPSDVPAT